MRRAKHPGDRSPRANETVRGQASRAPGRYGRRSTPAGGTSRGPKHPGRLDITAAGAPRVARAPWWPKRPRDRSTPATAIAMTGAFRRPQCPFHRSCSGRPDRHGDRPQSREGRRTPAGQNTTPRRGPKHHDGPSVAAAGMHRPADALPVAARTPVDRSPSHGGRNVPAHRRPSGDRSTPAGGSAAVGRSRCGHRQRRATGPCGRPAHAGGGCPGRPEGRVRGTGCRERARGWPVRGLPGWC